MCNEDEQLAYTAKNWPNWALYLVVPPSRHAAWVTMIVITGIDKVGQFFTCLADVLSSAHMRGCYNRGWKEDVPELPGAIQVGPFRGRSSNSSPKHEE